MAAAEKQAVTGAGPFNDLLTWIDQRFPLVETWRAHLSEYYAPKNFNFWYYFGSLALFVLVIQIVTGIFLTMNYKPDASQAFASVEYIMREVPWGQMSYWGAQVIVNLFDAIPVIGPDLAIWIRGDYVVSDATLNRFFAYHVIAVPLVLLALVVAHLLALHEVGSNNPDGVEIKKVKDPKTGRPLDGIPFHPYYTVKDSFGVVVFLVVFSIVVFFAPEAGGYFLEANNFIPADPLKTPAHIAPVWYFTPYYSILRATTEEFVFWALAPALIAFALLIIWSVKSTATRIAVGVSAMVLLLGLLTLDAKVWGVVLMGTSVVIFFFLPWLDRSPVRSIRYKGPITKTAIALFVIAFFVLGYLGTESVTATRTLAAQIGTAVYFLFFFLMPWYSRMDKCRPEPQRVTWK